LTCSVVAPACTDSQSGDDLQIDEDASAKADGALWYKLYTCNGSTTLDVNGNERRNLQLVIRDGNIIKFLNDRGVIQSSFGATEAVLSGWTGYVDWAASLGPVLHYQPYGGVGVFNRSDFNHTELIANTNYYNPSPFIRVFKDGNGIKVQSGQINNTWCGATDQYCPGDGFPCSTYCTQQHTEFVEKANWYFDSCQ
jgi:hypothetical protein